MAGLAELEELLTSVKAGKAKSLFLFFGDQDYLVRQAYDRILEALVPPDLRAFNTEQHDGTRVEVNALLDVISVVPMMQGPKAVGVVDARFFASKSNAGDLLVKARERWDAGEALASLRLLGRVLALAGWDWSEAQGQGIEGFKQALENNELNDSRHGGPWLERALAQGLASDLQAQSGSDESGSLAEGLEALLGQVGPAPTYVVFAAPAADARKRLFKLIQERGHVLDFRADARDKQALQTTRVFLRHELTKHGLKMSQSVGERFLGSVGSDLGALVQELDKLQAYAHPRQDISEDDLRAISVPRLEDDVFRLMNALGDRDLAAALDVAQSLVVTQEEMLLFNMLVKEARFLLLARTLIDEGWIPARGVGEFASFKASLAPKLGKELPPALGVIFSKGSLYPLYLGLKRAQRFEAARLRELIEALLQADLGLKTSTGTSRRALEDACARMCGAREETIV